VPLIEISDSEGYVLVFRYFSWTLAIRYTRKLR
jgi:hypothetical protein